MKPSAWTIPFRDGSMLVYALALIVLPLSMMMIDFRGGPALQVRVPTDVFNILGLIMGAACVLVYGLLWDRKLDKDPYDPDFVQWFSLVMAVFGGIFGFSCELLRRRMRLLWRKDD